MTHFNFVSPEDYPEYTPQEGDTWTDFRAEGKWDPTGTVKSGKGIITYIFTRGEWVEEDAAQVLESIVGDNWRDVTRSA